MNRQFDIAPTVVLSQYIESLSAGQSLNDALVDVARYIEANSSQPVYVSILLLDESGKHLFRGAAPSLPEEYSKQIDGIAIGKNVGSCGTAVFCGHSIYAVDIERDELWADFKDLALSHNLRACWSVPIISTSSKILGTFALYYSEIKSPSLEDRKFIEECAQSVATLIESNS